MYEKYGRNIDKLKKMKMDNKNRRITLPENRWWNLIYILDSYEAYDYADEFRRQLSGKKKKDETEDSEEDSEL